MAITRLPNVTDVSYYEFEVELDDVEFKLRFRYIDRDDAWYLSILDTEDNQLRDGIKIVNEWSLLRLWAEATRPDGEILSVNQGEILAPATLNQLGAEVILDYLDAAEIAALAT